MDYLKLWVYPAFAGSLHDAARGVMDVARREGISYAEAIRGLYPHLRHSPHMQTLAHSAFGNGYAEFVERHPFAIEHKGKDSHA